MEEIRRQLKSWENAFKEINGRKTTKADLDVAPANIRGKNFFTFFAFLTIRIF